MSHWLRSADGSETVRAMTEREEIERLRAALREIARLPDVEADEASGIARRALEQSTEREYDPNVAPCDDAEFGMKP